MSSFIYRDASWELEENAYQELLQHYEHCDVRRCRCKEGRDYNVPNRYTGKFTYALFVFLWKLSA